MAAFATVAAAALVLALELALLDVGESLRLAGQQERGIASFPNSLDFEDKDWAARLSATGSSAGDDTMTAVFLTGYPEALCLDGSPGAYYLRTGTNKDKWLVYFEGGGWCQSPEFCLQRSPGHLGSSRAYPATINLGNEYFSTDEQENPVFHDWNIAYLKYCDGGSFSGMADEPLVVDGQPIYFRGGRILEAIMDDLMSRGMGDATELVVSGGSAGGLATYLHADRFRDLLLASSSANSGGSGGGRARVTALPHSGFFPDYELKGAAAGTQKGHFHSGQKWVFEAMNATGAVNSACVEALSAGGEAWKCMFAEHTAPFISTPVFALQSQYDSWTSGSEFGAASRDVAVIREQGTLVSGLVQSSLLSSAANGAFLDSCHHHMGGWDSIVIDGMSMKEAFAAWYADPGGRRAWVQDRLYPCPDCCGSKASFALQERPEYA